MLTFIYGQVKKKVLKNKKAYDIIKNEKNRKQKE